MRIININLDDLSSQNLDIGYVGESHHVAVYIHCASFFKAYPTATAAMVAEPPEGDLYPVNLTRDNSTLVWTINDSDLVNPGSGKFQITFTQGEEIIKTAFGSFSVSASMTATGDPPEPIEDWLQEAQDVLNDVESFIENASGATIPMSSSDSTKIATAIGTKLNANQGSGNAGKFLKVGNDGAVTPDTVDLSGKADKVSSATSGDFAGLDANGNLTDSGSKASDFATKVSSATSGNFAGLDANGNLTDSGKKASDFATTQDLSGKVNEPASEGTSGQVLTTDGSGGRSWETVTTSDMIGATASTAGTHGLVPAPSAGDQDKVLMGSGTWGTVGAGLLIVDTPFSIPAENDSISFTMAGITASHQLIRWNFSTSAENNPPADLEWTTGAGMFTITNNGGTTSETMQPVFAETISTEIEEIPEGEGE